MVGSQFHATSSFTLLHRAHQAVRVWLRRRYFTARLRRR